LVGVNLVQNLAKWVAFTALQQQKRSRFYRTVVIVNVA